MICAGFFPHCAGHSFASGECESIFRIKSLSRNILPKNIDFQPPLTYVFSDCLDVAKDACAYSESSVIFCNAQARYKQAFVMFFNSPQSDNFRFKFDKITGKSEESKCTRLCDMYH